MDSDDDNKEGDHTELEYTSPVLPTFLDYIKQTKQPQLPVCISKRTHDIIVHMIHVRGFTKHSEQLTSAFPRIQLDTYTNESNKQCVVAIVELQKFGIKHARYIKEKLNDPTIIQLILVSLSEITPLAKKALSHPMIDTFLVDQLKFPFYEHKMIPTHVLCSPDDIKHLQSIAAFKTSQLPILPKTDPICHFYGWQTGSIIRCVTNLSSSGIPNVKYRTVK